LYFWTWRLANDRLFVFNVVSLNLRRYWPYWQVSWVNLTYIWRYNASDIITWRREDSWFRLDSSYHIILIIFICSQLIGFFIKGLLILWRKLKSFIHIWNSSFVKSKRSILRLSGKCNIILLNWKFWWLNLTSLNGVWRINWINNWYIIARLSFKCIRWWWEVEIICLDSRIGIIFNRQL